MVGTEAVGLGEALALYPVPCPRCALPQASWLPSLQVSSWSHCWQEDGKLESESKKMSLNLLKFLHLLPLQKQPHDQERRQEDPGGL